VWSMSIGERLRRAMVLVGTGVDLGDGIAGVHTFPLQTLAGTAAGLLSIALALPLPTTQTCLVALEDLLRGRWAM
jgi:hypothetical protein